MFPSFELFGRQISCYALCSVIGLIVAGTLGCVCVRRAKEDENNLIIFALVSVTGAFFGGHLLYAAVNAKFIRLFFEQLNTLQSFEMLINRLLLIFGGSVFYGGLLGGILTAAAFGRKKQYPMRLFADVSAFCIPLFHAFGRIGCALGGCCFGVESPFGIFVKNPTAADAAAVCRFPVQLCEAAVNVLIFAAIFALYQRQRLRGRLLCVYLLSYPVARFILEFFRGDEYRGVLLGLSTSQWISIAIICGTLVWLICHRECKHIINPQ